VLRNGDEIIFGGSRLRVELPTSLNETFLPTNPRVTIEDALSVQDSPASLPQNWQEGMTVFVSRAKLLAEIEKPLTATKSAPPVRESLCARLLAKVKRLIFFFKNSPLSQSRS
jgi:hypothetical protein